VALRLGPKQLESPLELALYGGQRSIQCGGNLFRRQIFLVTKDQRRTLRLGQRGEDLFQPRA